MTHLSKPAPTHVA